MKDQELEQLKDRRERSTNVTQESNMTISITEDES